MDKHSPMPWRVKQNSELSNWLVIRPDKTVVCAAWREADAALIVEAVNERNRLRDLVRRLADTLQSIIDAAEGRGVGRLDEGLVREAREALGEAQP